MSKLVNETQRRFAELCAHGGGLKGGPVRSKVLELLRISGLPLNANAYAIAKEQFEVHADADAW
jgi:hypothetical protein